jgi:hypothetical protein
VAAVIKDPPFNYFRWQGTGTTGDTTLIAPKYVIKK